MFEQLFWRLATGGSRLYMDYIDWIQWPAMVVTIAAAWMVGSQREHRRKLGFWMFLLSNVLWIIWGAYDAAYALIVLQLGLAAMNIRGSIKNSEHHRPV